MSFLFISRRRADSCVGSDLIRVTTTYLKALYRLFTTGTVARANGPVVQDRRSRIIPVRGVVRLFPSEYEHPFRGAVCCHSESRWRGSRGCDGIPLVGELLAVAVLVEVICAWLLEPEMGPLTIWRCRVPHRHGRGRARRRIYDPIHAGRDAGGWG
jgi:hypothetical protein